MCSGKPPSVLSGAIPRGRKSFSINGVWVAEQEGCTIVCNINEIFASEPAAILFANFACWSATNHHDIGRISERLQRGRKQNSNFQCVEMQGRG